MSDAPHDHSLMLPTGTLLDTRSADAFERGHDPLAANIPLEELDARVHELPSREAAFAIFDDDTARIDAALRFFRQREYAVANEASQPAVSHSVVRDRSTWVTGKARVRLWRPHALLERAAAMVPTTAAVDRAARPVALDLACGSGRDAVYLAMCGFDVIAVDHLPDALDKASDLARRCGVTIDARCLDLTRDHSWHACRCDLVTVFNYLDRDLIDAMRGCVQPGGLMTYETFVAPQRERYGKPRRETFELRRDELHKRFADWQIEHYDEAERRPGRITAALIARRPS